MRLWHQDLIHYLPRQQLIGQHRECCALRGKGWQKKHSVVNYVFKHPKSWLFFYHSLVMFEMACRGYKTDYSWQCWNYCGKSIGYETPQDKAYQQEYGRLRLEHPQRPLHNDAPPLLPVEFIVYSDEHDDAYLIECIENLRRKGVELVNGMTLN